MISHPVLDQLGMTGVRLGLDRIRAFLDAIDEPHRCAPVVHVAGTNGKGSVCAFVTAALVDAGYTVGTTISPHLEEINERIQIDGIPVDDATLTEAIDAVDRARWAWARENGIQGVPLTYFEFTIATAFWIFARRRVQVMVVEVGMGGRLDATNVVHPLVCAIPHIGLDHVAELGATTELIAVEKAGIIKRGVPTVIGPLPTDARVVFERVTTALGCTLWKPGNHLRKEQRKTGWTFATPAGALGDVTLGLEGPHQGSNAMVALGALHQLRQQGFLIPDVAIRSGFARAYIGGRIEEVLPGLWMDGAHNVDGAKTLAAWLATRPRPRSRILLWGMGEDRDPVQLLTPLLPHFDEVVTTTGGHPKARDPGELALALQDLDVVLSAGGPIGDVLGEVYAEADEVFVSGSLYLVGAAKRLVREGLLDGITPGSAASREG